MAKNKARNHQKRRQKAALKSTRRKSAQKPVPPKTKKFVVTEEMFPQKELLFWLAHGVNYIVSDYDNATWTPLFEEIYEGVEITPEQMARGIIDKFGESYENWSDVGDAALAWSIQPRQTVYIYFLEILKRLREKKYTKSQAASLACAPHNGIVWSVFRMIQNELIERKKKREAKQKRPLVKL